MQTKQEDTAHNEGEKSIIRTDPRNGLRDKGVKGFFSVPCAHEARGKTGTGTGKCKLHLERWKPQGWGGKMNGKEWEAAEINYRKVI